jgi:hypothetical protein
MALSRISLASYFVVASILALGGTGAYAWGEATCRVEYKCGLMESMGTGVCTFEKWVKVPEVRYRPQG